MRNNSREQLELINQQLKELASIYSKSIKKCTVSTNEFWIWYSLIIMDGEYTQQDICKSWSLSKQTVNTIITQMVQRRFISLEVIPGTRNKKIIRLTEEGLEYGRKIVIPIVSAEQRAFEKLPNSDREMFIKILDKYKNNLKEEFLISKSE